MLEEHVYVGIRRNDCKWDIRAIEEISADDLKNVDLSRDFRSTVVLGPDLDEARSQIALQASRGVDPFAALGAVNERCPVLDVVRGQMASESPESRVISSFDFTPGAVVTALRQHQATLLQTLEARVRRDFVAGAALTHEQFLDCFPLLLDALSESVRSRRVRDDLTSVARVHAAQRQQLGWTASELMREYALLCEAVATSVRSSASDSNSEDLVMFYQIVLALAAQSLDEFTRREHVARRSSQFEQLGTFSHELEKPLKSARLAWNELVRSGSLIEPFSTAVSRGLSALNERVDGMLATASFTKTSEPRALAREPIEVSALLREVELDSHSDRTSKRVGIRVENSFAGAVIFGDYRLLLSGLTILVRNSVEYTDVGGLLRLRVRAEERRLLIEVHDGCGGLPPARAERLFHSFTHAHERSSGAGLGLAAAKQAIEAHDGTLMVRDAAPLGCVFVIDLPIDHHGPVAS